MDAEFVVTLTIYGEARGESIEGQIAVANVIKNRVKRRNCGYVEICFEPAQFSCWNDNDPNRKLLQEIIDTKIPPDNMFLQCQYIAAGVMNGKLLDNVKGADHYLEKHLFYSTKRPSWAKHTINMTEIKNHVFFSLVRP